jgi:hypothetical protein
MFEMAVYHRLREYQDTTHYTYPYFLYPRWPLSVMEANLLTFITTLSIYFSYNADTFISSNGALNSFSALLFSKKNAGSLF